MRTHLDWGNACPQICRLQVCTSSPQLYHSNLSFARIVRSLVWLLPLHKRRTGRFTKLNSTTVVTSGLAVYAVLYLTGSKISRSTSRTPIPKRICLQLLISELNFNLN